MIVRYFAESLSSSLPAEEVKDYCRGHGFTVFTIKAAKKMAGITSAHEREYQGTWFWTLPTPL